GLTADDDARVAVLAEDHRWAWGAVVVVGHRVSVGAGDRRDEDVADARVGERDVAYEQVAGLAVLARDVRALAAARELRSVGEERLVRGPIEHWTEIVGHAAVDRDPGRDGALDRLDRIERDGRIRDQR